MLDTLSPGGMLVEPTGTGQSISPAASAFAWTARSIRSNVLCAAHRRERV
ncbi:hypothetical protein [Streptomyces olivaceoviridis]